jgi:outer membrane protein OmpA-like peptidoglycan-associated protein
LREDKMKDFIKFFFVGIIMVGLSGCANPKLDVAPVSISDNPSAKIAEFEQSLSDARIRQVNVLSPTWYEKAEEFLSNAQEGLEQNGSVEEVLQTVAFGQAHLDKAREYANIARSAIGETIKARDLAISAVAAGFGEDFQRVENKFIGLTTDIENDNLSRADRNKDEVAAEFASLELRAIKETTLGAVQTLLIDAENNDADKIAPQTFKDAKEALAEADRYITEQRYESEAIQEKASFALFQAQRLVQIMSVSGQVESMQPEEIALWEEDRLHQVTAQLGSRDLRNETFEIQLQSAIESIASLQDDNQLLKEYEQKSSEGYETKIAELEAALAEQRMQIGILEGQSKEAQRERELLAQKELEAKNRLEAERRFNQNFLEVQAMFSEEQAEVYKQANNLIIRLRAIQFPVGKDVIMPNNYSLLSLVRKAIRTFGDPDITIEGHTDNTGSAASNALLSKARAEAVRQYFIANGTLGEEKITAVGYGSERPLAPNDTPEGRAVNRRIDVIIKAEMMP